MKEKTGEIFSITKDNPTVEGVRFQKVYIARVDMILHIFHLLNARILVLKLMNTLKFVLLILVKWKFIQVIMRYGNFQQTKL